MKNLSAEPTNKLYAWLPHDLEAEEIVILPDACPGKSPLPTGTAVRLHQANWRKFAVSDLCCGMRLLRSDLDAIGLAHWNKVADLLKANKGQLGDLGGGNHFLDALLSYSENRIYFLIHTGSRTESGLVDDVFERTVQWAYANRSGVQEAVEQVFGALDLVLDLPHNTYERASDGSVIIRKGTVKVLPGDLNVIPSNLHGTGRIVSRGECKTLAAEYDFTVLRQRVMMPDCVQDASLRTEGPYAYRDLDACLELLDGYIDEVERFSVIAYMGHL